MRSSDTSPTLRAALCAASVFALLACGPGAAGGDATSASDASLEASSSVCSSDRACDDERFCNGRERCAPDDPAADARGCAPAERGPCDPGLTCLEREGRCANTADAGPSDGAGADGATSCVSGDRCDCDGDGVRSAAAGCGGTDCDDDDAQRFPGNRERCDGALADGRPAAAHDEDCNPCTVSGEGNDGDGDGDGFVAQRCRNGFEAGTAPSCSALRVTTDTTARTVTGRDCDDANNQRRPDIPEVCNGVVDDNCNPADDLDERSVSYFVDSDGDGFGPGSAPVNGFACLRPRGTVERGGDCDDRDEAVHPGAREVCNRRDDDCSESATARGAQASEDEDGDGHAPLAATCAGPDEAPGLGAFPKDDCDDREATTYEGAPELCDARDNDCNPRTLELARRCAAGGVCGAGGVCEPQPRLVAIAAGNNFTCVLRNDGRVWCWGANDRVQLGGIGSGVPGAPYERPVPAFAPPSSGLGALTSLEAGAAHVCGVNNESVVVCWGDNSAGQLGPNARTSTTATATELPEQPDALVVSAGGAHTCFYARDGQVRCFGRNQSGQLGAGVVAPGAFERSPLEVTSFGVHPPGTPGEVRGLALGENTSCALRRDGAVWCWGANSSRQLGVATPAVRATAAAVPGLTGAALADARLVAGADSWLLERGEPEGPWGWGSNASSVLTETSSALLPTRRTALRGYSALALGAAHGCGLSSGEVWCWGQNTVGQLGTGAATPMTPVQSAPVRAQRPTGFLDVQQLALGVSHSCARTRTNDVFCWGANDAQQLGRARGAAGNTAAPGLVVEQPWRAMF